MLAKKRLPIPPAPEQGASGALAQFALETRGATVMLGWVIQCGWVAALWALYIYKMVYYPAITMSHYTNWAWLMRCVQRTLVLIPRTRLLSIAWLFLPLRSVAWSVLLFVYIAETQQPDFIFQYDKRFGGEYETGTVLAFDRLFHVVPVLDDGLFIYAAGGVLAACIETVVRGAGDRMRPLLWFWAWNTYIGHLVTMLGYAVVVAAAWNTTPWGIYAIDVRRFPQVTSVFLMLFMMTLLTGVWLADALAKAYLRPRRRVSV